MVYLVSAAISLVIGIPTSYVLNRRFTAKIYKRTFGRELPRKISWIFVMIVWLDAAIEVSLLILLGKKWWVAIVAWLIVNYIIIVLLTIKINHAAKREKLSLN